MSMDRLNRLGDDEVWALIVRESYHHQLEKESDSPVLIEDLLWATPGGDCFEMLGRLGLKIANYRDGTYIEPESKYPRRGEAELLNGKDKAA